jgi:hypothetical protein
VRRALLLPLRLCKRLAHQRALVACARARAGETRCSIQACVCASARRCGWVLPAVRVAARERSKIGSAWPLTHRCAVRRRERALTPRTPTRSVRASANSSGARASAAVVARAFRHWFVARAAASVWARTTPPQHRRRKAHRADDDEELGDGRVERQATNLQQLAARQAAHGCTAVRGASTQHYSRCCAMARRRTLRAWHA